MEDDNLILRSYEDYMLAGTTSTAITRRNSCASSTSSRPIPEDAPRRFRTLLTAFASSVANKWMYYDDELSTVLSSIDNLRQRLPVIHRQWVQRKKQRQDAQHVVVPPWTPYNSTSKLDTHSTCSYGSPPAVLQLTEEDLVQTLHHELQNHEKYMAHVRKLLLQMSDAVQTASRQLDAAFLFYQQHRHTLATQNHYYYTASFLLDLACDVFTIISKELYERQTLAQTMLFNTDSDMDPLLPEDDPYNSTTGGTISAPVTAYSTSLSLFQTSRSSVDDTMRLNLFLDHLIPKDNQRQSFA